MSGAIANLGIVPTVPRLFDRERIIATAGFNRWLVPPAALAIHLCIGMAYGFSVFWLPLSRALGVTRPAECPGISFAAELFTVTCDWRISSLGWMYTLFFVMLGSSAAIWGGWLERVGPRKAAVVSALCWCGGPPHWQRRHCPASALAPAARTWDHRRYRVGLGLHFACIDADQMVSRSARHGHRNGDHGFRGRSHDRCAPGRHSHECLQVAYIRRSVADAGGDGSAAKDCCCKSKR